MEKLVIPIINIVPTMRCNLRCKFCSTGAPYYPQPYHPTMERLYEQADRLFEIMDYTDRFIISGGEPMVRNDLYQWVNYLAKYADRIGRLELNSNGTIAPNSYLLESLSAYPGKKRFLVDNYGPEISAKARQIAELFEAVPNSIVEPRDYYTDNKYCGGWVNYGVYELSKMKQKSREEAIRCWSTCSSPRARYFMTVYNGKLYHCARQIWLVENGIEAEHSEDIVDLFDFNRTIDQLKEDIAALYRKRAFKTCEFCCGLHDDAQRYKPAMQMSKDEQQKIWRENSNVGKI